MTHKHWYMVEVKTGEYKDHLAQVLRSQFEICYVGNSRSEALRHFDQYSEEFTEVRFTHFSNQSGGKPRWADK